MLKRLVAIAVIFCGASIAWLILGQTILARTNESDSTQTEKLTAQWGSSQTQTAPDVFARVAVDTYNADKKRVERSYEDVAVPFSSTKIDVDLELEQRRKGLLWYNLYDVRFASHYRIRNDTSSSRLSLHFPFPSADGSYTNFSCLIGGRRVERRLGVKRESLELQPRPGAARRRSTSATCRAAWIRGSTASVTASSRSTIFR